MQRPGFGLYHSNSPQLDGIISKFTSWVLEPIAAKVINSSGLSPEQKAAAIANANQSIKLIADKTERTTISNVEICAALVAAVVSAGALGPVAGTLITSEVAAGTITAAEGAALAAKSYAQWQGADAKSTDLLIQQFKATVQKGNEPPPNTKQAALKIGLIVTTVSILGIAAFFILDKPDKKKAK
jgi:hypothetical protein